MKRTHFLLALAAALSMGALPADGRVPTLDEVKAQIVPLLLIREIATLRMAAFDLSDIEKLRFADFEAQDLSLQGDPGCSKLSFRIFFRATEDIYGELLGKGPDGEIQLARVGRAGRSYSMSFENLHVQFKTVEGEDGNLKTILAFARDPYAGDLEWEADGILSAASKSCWEAITAVTGAKLRFYDSPNDVPGRR